jgi:hypothetical protein
MKGDSIKAAEREDKRVRREARTIAAFLNGGPPDFLMEAMLTAIAEAVDYFGLPQPDGDYDEQNLQPLFLKTKLISWDSFGSLENPKAQPTATSSGYQKSDKGERHSKIGGRRGPISLVGEGLDSARILQFRKGTIVPCAESFTP